jgi:hypothetical protein
LLTCAVLLPELSANCQCKVPQQLPKISGNKDEGENENAGILQELPARKDGRIQREP